MLRRGGGKSLEWIAWWNSVGIKSHTAVGKTVYNIKKGKGEQNRKYKT